MKMNSVVNAEISSKETVICVAVKEDRHRDIVSSVSLQYGAEEPRTIERVANFSDSLGYREITLKSDTELAIIAFM